MSSWTPGNDERLGCDQIYQFEHRYGADHLSTATCVQPANLTLEFKIPNPNPNLQLPLMAAHSRSLSGIY
jgi:hypothetical protein